MNRPPNPQVHKLTDFAQTGTSSVCCHRRGNLGEAQPWFRAWFRVASPNHASKGSKASSPLILVSQNTRQPPRKPPVAIRVALEWSIAPPAVRPAVAAARSLGLAAAAVPLQLVPLPIRTLRTHISVGSRARLRRCN